MIGVDRALDRRERRHDDDAEIRLPRQHLRQQVDARLGTEPEIEKHDIEVPAIQRFERGCTGRDAEDARARRLQAQSQRLTHAGIVVDDQRRPRRLAGGLWRRSLAVRRVPSLATCLTSQVRRRLVQSHEHNAMQG